MALQVPVITLSGHVVETQKNLYGIIFRMVCSDSDATKDGLDVTTSIRYRPGDAVADRVAGVIADFQARIDSYQSAVVIEDHAIMAAAIAAIQSGLVV